MVNAMMSSDRTVLLVDDNRDDVDLALRAFAKSGISGEIIVAGDGQEALDYLFATGTHASRGTELPQLVLLDLNLPKIEGREVLRRMRADLRTKLLPVVVLTTSNQEVDIAQCYELGANSYVRKPVDFAEFVEVTKQLATYWLALNEPPTRPPGS